MRGTSLLSAEDDSEGDFLADRLLVYLLKGLGLLPYLTRKYVAGKDIQSGLTVSLRLNERGLGACLTLVQFPESAKDAQQIAKHYEHFLNLSSLAGLHANVSISLPQLGFNFDPFLANELALCLLSHVARNNSFLWLNIHESVSPKINLESAIRFNQVPGLRGHFGLTLQANVYSVQSELDAAISKGIPVRLRPQALVTDRQLRIGGVMNIRRSYLRCVEKLLQSALPCAFATTNVFLLHQTIQYLRNSAGRSDTEFQFPYRPELPEVILKVPSPVRIDLPVGSDTEAYVSQCLLERVRQKKDLYAHAVHQIFSEEATHA